MRRTHAAGLSVGICLTALAVTVLFPVAAQRAAPPAFPTEWRGNDKWCPQSDMPTKMIYTRHDQCHLSDRIPLTADRYERKKIVCRLLSGHEGMRHRGRIYHAVMSCHGEHDERWFERADFFTPFPPDLLVVETIARRPHAPVLVPIVDRRTCERWLTG